MGVFLDSHCVFTTFWTVWCLQFITITVFYINDSCWSSFTINYKVQYVLYVCMERFAGLSIHSFNPIGVFTEILSHCLGQKCSLIKERCLYSQENFSSTLENHENTESLAKRIFPRLQYYKHNMLSMHPLHLIHIYYMFM